MNINTKMLTRSALLLALAIAVQQFKIQWLTGPAINAILILAVGYAGLFTGILIGVFTPVLALLQGIMPLAIVIPFIIVGNALYCLGFYWVKKYNSIIGIIVAAFIKFGFLALAVNFIIQVPPKVAQALSTPQLFTAIVGGLVAVLILSYLPKDKE